MRHIHGGLTAGDALAKLGRKPIDPDRPAALKLRGEMAGAMADALAKLAPLVIEQLQRALGLEKRDRRGGSPEAIADAGGRAGRALAAVQGLDFSEWVETLIATARPPLESMAMRGAEAALAQLGIKGDDLRPGLTDKTADWAAARAAEMVGMRRTADGDLVPNPNARWRIDESTREMVRGAVDDALRDGSSAGELARVLEDSEAFSAARAETIARTELALADMAGAMEGYRASGLVAGKTWSTSQDDKVSDECRECEAAGVIALDAPFPTGAMSPPNHPNCRCSVLPVLNDEMPRAGKATKEPDMTKLWADITKSEKQDDGTIKVWGYASAEVTDSDGEVVTADAMRAARDGYMSFANVREMHDPKKAAGVAIEYDVQEDGRTWFGAHVVDPVAVLKVETGVYKGFSIGARVPPGGRDGKVIKSIDLREVSLVDRPANPEAVFTMFKADGGGPEDTETEGGEPDIRKYAGEEISDAGTALQALGAIMYLFEKESAEPGEPSEQVASLRACVENLKRFIASEIVEDNTGKAAQTGEVAKAGRRFSSATKAALKAAHEACKAADKALADLGYDADEAESEDDAGKAAADADLEKVAADAAAESAALAAEAEQVTEIAKAAGLQIAEATAVELAKSALAELVTLRKAHADLLAQPAPPKGARMAVEKSADMGGEPQPGIQPVMKADGTVDEAATAIKKARLGVA